MAGEARARAGRDDTAAAIEALEGSIENRVHLFRHISAAAGEPNPERLLPISSLAGRFTAHPRLARALTRGAVLAAPLILPALALLSGAAALVAKLRHGPRSAPLPHRVLIATSYRLADIALRLPRDDRPDAWLIVPGIKMESSLLGTIPPGEARVPLLAAATWADVLWGIRAHWKATGLREIPVQSRVLVANALPWFVLWRVLSRMADEDREWWFANHYDQWAVLIDAVPVQARRVMLQHGIESENGGPHSLPRRLRRLNVLYCYGAEQERFFREHVLDFPEAVEARRVPVTIQLQEVIPPQPGMHRVLLIGSPAEFDREAALIDALQRKPNLVLLVKPHPLFPASRYEGFRGERLHLLQDRGRFPEVDLAVSPLSTLGMEYAAAGTPVVWHSGRPLEEVLAEIESVLEPATLPPAVAG